MPSSACLSRHHNTCSLHLQLANSMLHSQCSADADEIAVIYCIMCDTCLALLPQAEAELAAATADIEATLLELKRERLLAEVADGGDGDGAEPGAAAAADGAPASTFGAHSDVRIGDLQLMRPCFRHMLTGLPANRRNGPQLCCVHRRLVKKGMHGLLHSPSDGQL